jgi:hypothetical protein
MHPKIIDEFYGANIQLRNQLYIEREKTKQLELKLKINQVQEKEKRYQFIQNLLKMNISINDIKKLL